MRKFGALLLEQFSFFFIGLADDLFNLSPQSRLLVQSIVASFAWYKGVRIDFFLQFPLVI